MPSPPAARHAAGLQGAALAWRQEGKAVDVHRMKFDSRKLACALARLGTEEGDAAKFGELSMRRVRAIVDACSPHPEATGAALRLQGVRRAETYDLGVTGGRGPAKIEAAHRIAEPRHGLPDRIWNLEGLGRPH